MVSDQAPRVDRIGEPEVRPERDARLGSLGPLARTGPTLAEEVAAELRTRILDGRLPPGMPLRLHALAARLEVSVMPIREALRQLEAEDLVQMRPYRGAVVTELSRDELEEQYAVRAALEGLAAGIAARAVSNAQREDLDQRLEAMRIAADAQDMEAFLAADRAFHAAIYRVSGRVRLQERIAELAMSTRRSGLLAVGDWQTDASPGVEAHRRILDAVKSGDREHAEHLTREHVWYGAHRALGALDGLAGGSSRAAGGVDGPRRRRTTT